MNFVVFGHPLRHWLEAGAAFSVLGIFRLLGLERASALGGFIGRTLGPRLGVSRRIRRNLARAMPESSEAERTAIEKSTWDNLVRTIAESVHTKHLRDNDSRFTITGMEHIHEAANKGKGIIFVSGHYANWESMLKIIHAAGLQCCVAYRHANNHFMDQWIVKWRENSWGFTMTPKGRRGAQTIIKYLRAGKSIAMLVDQKMNSGIEAKFFGLPAMTTPSPAQLALRYGAPVIFVSMTREPGPRFHITAWPAQEPPATPNTEQNIALFTQTINDFLEARTRERPGEWLWLHNRWPND